MRRTIGILAAVILMSAVTAPLRAAGNAGAASTAVSASAAAKRTGAGGVVAKSYHCVFFVVDHLVDAAPFTIKAGGRYTDRDGVRGTYTRQGNVLTFHGGNYNGQRAEYDTTGARPAIHILGPSGRRVIDCD